MSIRIGARRPAGRGSDEIGTTRKALPACVLAAGLAILVVTLRADVRPLRVGDLLPSVDGQYLTGRPVTLPSAMAGKVVLIVIGFSFDARHQVEPWGAWARKAMAGNPGATFFEMPVIGRINRLARWLIDIGMRRATPVEMREHVIAVYSGAGDWKKRVGHTEATDNDAFLILTDQKGIIRWLHRGACEPPVAEEVRNVMTSLSAGQSDPAGRMP